eukprot:1949606-Pyramimonas_sp.AAC.1
MGRVLRARISRDRRRSQPPPLNISTTSVVETDPPERTSAAPCFTISTIRHPSPAASSSLVPLAHAWIRRSADGAMDGNLRTPAGRSWLSIKP